MNKFALVLSLLVSLNVLAGPRVIGNGGDVIEENPVSVAYVQNIIPDARLFILMWLHGLEGQMFLNNGLKGSNPRQLPIPTGANKLFSTEFTQPKVYDKMRELKINFKTQSACGSGGINETDGSTSSDKPNEICISGFSLARKLNDGNAKVQVEALIIHEISHLLGTTEEEAKAIQSQYIEDMRYVSKESIVKYANKVIEVIDTSKSYYFQEMMSVATDYDKLCNWIYTVRGELDQIFTYSEITPISLFSVENRDLADSLTVFEGQMLQRYVCGRSQSHPVTDWVKEYEKGFANNNVVSVTDWLINLGINGVRKTTATSSFMVKKINNQRDLEKDIISLPYMLDKLQYGLVCDLHGSFEVQLDEK